MKSRKTRASSFLSCGGVIAISQLASCSNNPSTQNQGVPCVADGICHMECAADPDCAPLDAASGAVNGAVPSSVVEAGTASGSGSNGASGGGGGSGNTPEAGSWDGEPQNGMLADATGAGGSSSPPSAEGGRAGGAGGAGGAGEAGPGYADANPMDSRTLLVIHLRNWDGTTPRVGAYVRLGLQDASGMRVLDPTVIDQAVFVTGSWFVLYSGTGSSQIMAIAATPGEVGPDGVVVVPEEASAAMGCTYKASIDWTGLSGDALIVNGVRVSQGTATVSLSSYLGSTLFVTELLAGLGQRLWSRPLSSAERACPGSTTPTPIPIDPGSNPMAYALHPMGSANLSFSAPLASETFAANCWSVFDIGSAETCLFDTQPSGYAVATDATESNVTVLGSVGASDTGVRRTGRARIAPGAPAPLDLLLLSPTQVSLSYDGAAIRALITPSDQVQRYQLASSDSEWKISATPAFVALGQPIRTPTWQEFHADAAGTIWGNAPSTRWTLRETWSSEGPPALARDQQCVTNSMAIGQHCAYTTQGISLASN